MGGWICAFSFLSGGEQNTRRDIEEAGDHVGRRLTHSRTQQAGELQVARRMARAEDPIKGSDVIAENKRASIERPHSIHCAIRVEVEWTGPFMKRTTRVDLDPLVHFRPPHRSRAI